MHDKGTETGASKLAWELFEKTGNLGYYLLYRDLKNKDEK